MKNITCILPATILLLWGSVAYSQNIQWNSLSAGQKHMVNLNAGFDYSFNLGVGYGYRFNGVIPIVLNAEYSAPAGSNVFDDLKSKVGVQAKIGQWGHFLATARVYGIFRRYENDIVQISGFGSETGLTCGYYRSRWFAAAECGFDKAIATHFTHSELARKDFPGIQDGWYVPSAGNFFYGIQSGFSVKKQDFYLKIGNVLSQDLKTKPTVPFYFQVGVNRRF